MNKDVVYRTIGTLLLGIIIFLIVKTSQLQRKAARENTALKKSILSADRLTKEADGRYSKLVDYYRSQRDLMQEIKKYNSSLYREIKKNDEKLLSITSSIISLESKVVQGFAKPDSIDTNKLTLSLKYPDEKDPFVFWDGWLNRTTAAYRGTFSFGKLPIKVILTEESRGLWKSRIIGPDWLRVDSMSIISIPPEEYTVFKPKKVQWLVGGSYVYSMNTNLQGLGVTVGLNLFDKHNILFGATTLNQVSIGYLYKIKTLKRNNK